MSDRRNAGEVDFTMMYAAHDAFTRHLERLIETAGKRPLARWELFEHQLHLHHTAEDSALWPPLRMVVTDPDEVAVLDAMDLEHAAIDPLVERLDEAFADGDPTALLGELLAGLGAHMAHEESAALPLVEKHLGQAGWDAFGDRIRRTQGLRAGAVYFPWLLEGAPDSMTRRVLGVLPPPVRLVLRLVWVPRYRRAIG